jgi:hypothetical protein
VTGFGATAMSGESQSFLQLSKTLWEAQAPTKKPSFWDRVRQREGEELKGKRDFPFSITIPERAKFPVEKSNEGREIPLPSSMMESGAGVSVVYELEVCVKKGTLGMNSL